MNKKLKILFGLAAAAIFVAILVVLVRGHTVDIMQPQGQIAHQQKNLIIFASLLSLVVVIPVFVLTFGIAWKYREGNHKSKYTPEWGYNRALELTWWLIPGILIIILSIVTWQTSHSLDPFKPLASTKKPLTIQVVALEWKWLFIYPDQDVATVNTLTIPEKTPINFKITADAPMNSFWIPQLGGQIYAMSGMSTKLHLESAGTGMYRGSSANLSGEGFAGMNFPVKAVTRGEFNQWLNDTKHSTNYLSLNAYNRLAEQSQNNPATEYGGVQPRLYDTILGKYMSHNMKHGAEQ